MSHTSSEATLLQLNWCWTQHWCKAQRLPIYVRQSDSLAIFKSRL